MEKSISRRQFLKMTATAASGAAIGAILPGPVLEASAISKPIVSVVKIKKGNIQSAVEQAIDLLGGVATATGNAESIMLKPNLAVSKPDATTDRAVVGALARVLKGKQKRVIIGEGSALAPQLPNGMLCHTKDVEYLTTMQKRVFHKLGYTDLAKQLGIPLVNLHVGDMAFVPVENFLVEPIVTLHKSLTQIDLLVSMPLLKTYQTSQISLAMQNLWGTLPATEYANPRMVMHDAAAKVEASGTASANVDLVRANRVGLTVVDATKAMHGQTIHGVGPHTGIVTKMNLIIAGTHPLPTDMVAAHIMGFDSNEIPQIGTFKWARKVGMSPAGLDEIEIRGVKPAEVRRKLKRAEALPWLSGRFAIAPERCPGETAVDEYGN
jgi:uncharacterized protein (DUF362 family)